MLAKLLGSFSKNYEKLLQKVTARKIKFISKKLSFPLCFTSNTSIYFANIGVKTLIGILPWILTVLVILLIIIYLWHKRKLAQEIIS